MITVSLYLDFYGLVDADVWNPSSMGRGLQVCKIRLLIPCAAMI